MINKDKLKKEFSRHAAEYDRFAALQFDIAEELLAKIPIIPQRILDLGCGTGAISLALARKFPKAQIHAVDIAEGMIKVAESKAVELGINNIAWRIEDLETLSFPEESFDLIISSAALQWTNHLPLVFARLFKLLDPGGCLLFSIFGKKSLCELREAAKKAYGNKYNYEQTFPDTQEITNILNRSSFKMIKVDSAIKERIYDSVEHLLKTLKNIGAQNSSIKRPLRLIPKGEWAAMLEYYKEKFGIETKIKATYEILYGVGFRPEEL
ncbi:malonyl-ACP O-methyltransferase BioC [Candidatus Margulisiibacteriota bacterium]